MLTYVTGNYGKYISVKEKFESAGLSINYEDIDLEEPAIDDIEYISHEKARLAYEKVKSPVFVVDCGFYINGYPNKPGYPGALVKRSGISTDIDKLLKTMEGITDRSCYFLDCLTYYDGVEFYTFYGKSEGSLALTKRGNSLKRAKSNLWYVYIPSYSNKTLAEMTEEEHKNRNNKENVTIKFIEWYKEHIFSKKLSITL